MTPRGQPPAHALSRLPRSAHARARPEAAIRRARLRARHRAARPPLEAFPPRSALRHWQADPRHQPSVHLPLLRTMTSRSFSRERNDTTLPSTHISVTIVSPGKTGLEKRTSKPVIFAASYLQTVEMTERQAVPYVQRPCRIGRGKPAALATFGSR